ncbi:hypothetical protein ANCCEY_06012 [Ancylostoma ceylanicum]|uniref:Uncharacterized protein n=1 Tax=Ancylostoma ceylanicum TaxID=53326 RepID=A0A0D6LXR7_9BILA|nr:hypothetical protein ANCCEY_06012 [Ancylostoma ceylanicum]
MVLWRAAGINYVRYSQIAAQLTKKCSKAGKVVERGRRPGATLKIATWENGPQRDRYRGFPSPPDWAVLRPALLPAIVNA